VWNVVAVRDELDGSYETTLIVKLAVVAASGVAAFVHGRSRTPRGLAVTGAVSALTALSALFLGVLLTEG
jgi:hypothetical protein